VTAILSGRIARHSRFTIALLLLSLLLPLALMLANSFHYNQRSIFADPRSLSLNWLYMGFPQLLWGILALVFVRSLSRVRVVTLLALDILLTCFQLWIWYGVPSREGADAWMLYIPLWILVLIAAFLIGLYGARRERRL
jgi:hypothetical protein